eukprot:1567546-Pleurochrysis_carterae.AAC.1
MHVTVTFATHEVCAGQVSGADVKDSATPEKPILEEQDVPDANMLGEDGSHFPFGEVAAEGTGVVDLTTPVIQCNRRIRVAERPDNGPCT